MPGGRWVSGRAEYLQLNDFLNGPNLQFLRQVFRKLKDFRRAHNFVKNQLTFCNGLKTLITLKFQNVRAWYERVSSGHSTELSSLSNE